MIDNVVQGGAGLHDVVHRTEHGGIRGVRDDGGGDGSGDQPDVVPAVRGDAFAGDVEHLLGGVDADDGPGGADLVLQLGHAQPGATAHVEDGVTALDG